MKDSNYHIAIREEMEKLAENYKVIFLGQQTLSESFYGTLKNIPVERRMEMPVAEDMQMGLSIGLALEGYLPVSIFQRMDFLPRACDQLVNHLNLMKKLTRDRYNPKVIIRTTIGIENVGLQHNKDLTDMFQAILEFPVVKVTTVEEVKEAYKLAREGMDSILIIEDQKLYSVKE